MNIGVVTFHRAYNYGVCLQAFATTYFLKEQGFCVELIDYTNPYEQRIQKWSYKENNRISGYLTSLLKNLLLGKKRYYQRGFGHIAQCYPLTRQRYTHKAQLDALEYDVLIAGSDQIWNAQITNGIDDVFLLRFGHAKRRISIASSMGSSTLTQAERQLFQAALTSFQAISVREDFARQQLQPLTDTPVQTLMDPTFLLDRAAWLRCMGQTSKYAGTTERYILTYLIAPDKNAYRARVKAYADKLNCPVWTIQYSNYTWKESNRKILGATPADFIALMANAELVLTDSFHGTAFSVNLRRNFVAFTHSTNPVRVRTLLQRIGLDDRLDMPAEHYRPVDYTDCNPRLAALQAEQKAWVLAAVTGVPEKAQV